MSVACNQSLLEGNLKEFDVQGVIIDDPILPPPIIFNPFTANPYAVTTMRDAFVELQASGSLPSDADIDDLTHL